MRRRLDDGSSSRSEASGRARPPRLHQRRGAARDRHHAGSVLVGARPHHPRPRAAEPRAARRSATACRRRSIAGTASGADRHFDLAEYKAFLQRIGYLLPEGADFSVTTANVDPEIAEIAGPQLVVPVMNARYALNAANARWGSLYDALYGTDAIAEDGGATRGRDTIPSAASRSSTLRASVLDEAAPLDGASWSDATALWVDWRGARCRARRSGRRRAERIRHASRAYQGRETAPSAVLLQHHGLHLEVRHRPQPPDRPRRPGRHRRRYRRIGDDDDHGLRGFDRRRRRRGQGAGLSQLARPDEGRPHRELRQRRRRQSSATLNR